MVTNSGYGIHVVDISTPAKPKEISHMDVDNPLNYGSYYWSILLSKDGKTVFAGTIKNGLFIFNITDPAKPTFLSRFKSGSAYIRGLDLAPDGNIFMAYNSNGVWWVDVSYLKNPKG